ncbi:hypothetical protein AMATHDRAFT_74251 [Amanita thiersii Skay4041]|uniref:Histone H1 n=1 Tax=Amanita thiersii Skay4041 TaxID=703135 RepID=A0A2A9NXH2_9AGAR|nr:hypothetical protein AMATHDRAFT_74251 [Amanita thiersii Skay4041]
MIVEALMESNDPEGCAPKDLFSWMASHYPLQSNFRPSASQALQKAYKRGRFEKSSNGKYRLSANWEGGNTSKRTTRRPQTQSQSAAGSSSTLASPFTQTPLVHHHAHQPPGMLPSYPAPPYGYPYPPGYHPYLPQLAPPPPSSSAPAPQPASQDQPQQDASNKDARDAYEAAQNILRAINFGSLLQLSNETDDVNKNGSVDAAMAGGAANPPATSVTVSGEGADGLANSVPPGTGPSVSGFPSVAGGAPANGRAELQAQLALLAAQLAGLANEQETPVVAVVQQPQPPPPSTPVVAPVNNAVPAEPPAPPQLNSTLDDESQGHDDTDDDDDMEAII